MPQLSSAFEALAGRCLCEVAGPLRLCKEDVCYHNPRILRCRNSAAKACCACHNCKFFHLTGNVCLLLERPSQMLADAQAEG